MGEYADTLAAFLDQIGVESTHFCGLSWGGTLSLEFYRRYPERVRSLVLADTYAGWAGSLGSEAAEARLARCLRESELPPEEWVPQWAPEAFSPDAPQEMTTTTPGSCGTPPRGVPGDVEGRGRRLQRHSAEHRCAHAADLG